jgi:protein MpaA
VTRVRQYTSIINRLEALAHRSWDVRQAGKVEGYPWYIVERNQHLRAPTILLTGGMHGEEPAGVEAVLQWLESPGALRWPVRWIVFPCINPYGWERNQRRNRQRRDINRQFRMPAECPESALIVRILKGRTVDVSLEFHEDVDADGYYLYELRRQSPFVGEKILRAVRRVMPLQDGETIDGSQVTKLGLIRRAADPSALRQRRRWPMAFHLYDNGAGHILGSETPVRLPFEQRVQAHLTAMEVLMQSL